MTIGEKFKIKAFEAAITANNPNFRRKLRWALIGVVSALTLANLACSFTTLFADIPDVDLPDITPDPIDPIDIPDTSAVETATSEPALQLVDLGDPIANIVDFGELGETDNLGNIFDAALPEAKEQLVLDFNGDQQVWDFGYSENAHQVTSFAHGPIGDVNPDVANLEELERMGQIHPPIYDVPESDLLDNCPVAAVPAPGLQNNNVNLNLNEGDYVVTPATTVGTTSSIFLRDMNQGLSGLPLRFQEYLMGAGGKLYDHGFLNWALFHRAGERLLEFVGFIQPNSQCPMYIKP